MASWKKVIVSGSDAELGSLTINQGTGLGKCTQIISSSATDTELFGTFDGTHIGDGKQLTDVTGSKVEVAANNTATVAKIVFTAGTGTQALCSDNDLTYNADTNTIGSNLSGNAATATTATTATCVNLTNAFDSSNDSYIPFSNGATGGQDLCTDNAFYYTPNTDTLTVSKINGTVSNATTASAVTVTESDGATAYTLVFATTGTGTKELLSDNELTYNASTNLLTTAGAINATGAICSAGLVSAGSGGAGTFSSNGSQNVVLTTGAGTSGTITINQGADGDIAITPNGTGEVVIGGSSPTISPAGGDATLTLDTGTSNVCVTNDLNVGGDLIVQGELAYLNVTNLAVEDRFILLNSGSATGDGGIIVQNSATTTGSAFIFDDSADRWGFTASLASNATTVTPDAYAAAVVTSDITAYRKNGNIRVESGDIYIYVE